MGGGYFFCRYNSEVIFLFTILRQGFTLYSRLALNSWQWVPPRLPAPLRSQRSLSASPLVVCSRVGFYVPAIILHYKMLRAYLCCLSPGAAAFRIGCGGRRVDIISLVLWALAVTFHYPGDTISNTYVCVCSTTACISPRKCDHGSSSRGSLSHLLVVAATGLVLPWGLLGQILRGSNRKVL